MPETIPVTDLEWGLVHGLIAKFVARADAYAIQGNDGQYRPIKVPLEPSNLIEHIRGTRTYGHYLIGEGNTAKFFAFDCDLEPMGAWVQQTDMSNIPIDAFTGPDREHWLNAGSLIHPAKPRDDWRNRAHPGRDWFKFQMRSLAQLLSEAITTNLGIPCIAAYSGNKGIHVYGLTGAMPAADVREAARLVLAATGRFVPTKGDNFYQDTSSEDWRESFANFKIEVFPKQDSVEPGHFGNLLRFPLGRNTKNPKDPTFFLDLSNPSPLMVPHPRPDLLLDSVWVS